MSDVVYNETSNTMFCKLFPQGGRGVEAWQKLLQTNERKKITFLQKKVREPSFS